MPKLPKPRILIMPLLSTLLSIAASPADAAGKSYTMKDLKALEKQGSWQELEEHLEDVPPASRDASWRKLVELTAIMRVKAAEPREAGAVASAYAKRYAFLNEAKAAKAFNDARREIGVKSLTACYAAQYGDSCYDEALALSTAMADGALSLEIGKLVIKNHFPYASMPVFRDAAAFSAKAKPNPACNDADLNRAVVAALKLPKDDKLVAPAQEVASRHCWDEMKEALTSNLEMDGKGSYFATNACGFLTSKGVAKTAAGKPCN